MELEYGLEIARPAQDLAFDSVETESAFVLRIRLPGEEREGIQIKVDEDGTKLRIGGGGGGSTRERVLARRAAGRFRKVFRVPEGVDTQRIEAAYDEDNEILAVYLPKLVTGPAVGTSIEEIITEEEEEEEPGAAKWIPWREPEEAHRDEETPVPVEMPEAALGSPESLAIAEEEPDRSREGEDESGEPLGVEVLVTEMEKGGGGGEEPVPPGRSEGGDGGVGTSGKHTRRRRSGAFPFCTPFMLAGSAFLFVAVALLFHVIRERSKRRTQ